MKFLIILMFMQYQQIPSEYFLRNNLYEYLIPNDSIIWWKAGTVNLYSGEQLNYYCSNPLENINIECFSSRNTYTSSYYDNAPFQSYLVYKTKSSQIHYFTKIEDFSSFIGEVDNLAEALFLASLYGFKPEKSSSFYFKNNMYIFYLTKILNAPDVIYTDIDEYGNVKEKTNNISKIKVCNNGDVFEMVGDNKRYIKLTIKDMYRPL